MAMLQGPDMSSMHLGRQPVKSLGRSFSNSSFGFSGLNASVLSGLNASGIGELGGARMASALRPPMDVSLASLSTGASFHGSGISDLRAAIVSQQKQLDTLVDKVAALLAAMHAEVIQDVRSASQQGGGQVMGCIDDLRRAESEVDGRLAELRDAEAGLRVWLQGELQSLHEQVKCEVEGLKDNLLSGDFGRDLQGLADRLTMLEVEGGGSGGGRGGQGWEAALEHTREELHDHLRQGMRHESQQGPLVARMHALEERVLETAMLPALPADMIEHVEYRERLDQLERGVQRGQVAMQHLEEGVHRMARLGDGGEERQAQWAQWRVWTEERLEQVACLGGADVQGRLDRLEHWQRRSQDSQPGRDPLRERVGSMEQRLDDVAEKMEALTVQLQQAKRGSGGGTAALDALGERVDTLSNTLQQDTRRTQQRLSEATRLGARVDDAEATLETIQRTLVTKQPDGFNQSEARWSQMQGMSQMLTEELRQDLDLRMTSMQGQTQRLLEEMRQDLETRVAPKRLMEELRQDMDAQKASSQRLQDELRQELETRCAQLRGCSDGVTDELREMQQELEAQMEQTQGLQQELGSQAMQNQSLPKQLEEQIGALKQGLEERIESRLESRMTQTHGLSQRLINELKQDVEGQLQQMHAVFQKLAQELRQNSKDNQALQQGFEALREHAEEMGMGGSDTIAAAFEARVAQVRGALQRLAEEFHESNNDVSSLREDVNQVMAGLGKDVDALKASISQGKSSSDNGQSFAELQRLVLKLQDEQESIATCAVDTACEAVHEAVSSLGCRLEKELAGRCDDGVAGCDRIMQEALSKVAMMEGQLRGISADLRTQLAQEGGTLLEALALPMGGGSMRLDNGDPQLAAASAARDMLNGMSPGSRSRGMNDGNLLDLTPNSRLRHRETALGTPPSSSRPSRPPNPALSSPHILERGRSSAMGNKPDELELVTQRLHQQERAFEELRQLQMSLQGELEGFLVEHRVSHSLAGLERRSRSPQAFRVASMPQAQEFLGAHRQ